MQTSTPLTQEPHAIIAFPNRLDSEDVQVRKSEILVGAHAECDIPFPGDPNVADLHCALKFVDGRWIVELLSGNRVWVDNREVRGRAKLRPGAVVSLGESGEPAFRLFTSSASTAPPTSLQDHLRQMRTLKASAIAEASRAAAEKPFQRKVISRGFTRLKRRHKRRLLRVTASLLVLLAATGAVAYKQQLRLSELRSGAEEIFYQMKTIKLQISRLEDIAAATGDSSALKDGEAMWAEVREMERQYENYLEELGFGEAQMSEEDRLILRVARLFGECELNMPEGFVKRVKSYIGKWRSTPRYRAAINRALSKKYPDYIGKTMMRYNLPPHFFYLAMQESDFRPDRVGPRTRFGIAKGMWQFIPSTAVYFGLKLGPFVEVRKKDPKDERHHMRKSTRAAAKYLRKIYTSEAQASGLLVMAAYNYGDTRVRKLINRMPDNPRDRNFWNLMNRFRLPKETRDYVFYIFSAAVIGENPRLFGFDFDNPLAVALN